MCRFEIFSLNLACFLETFCPPFQAARLEPRPWEDEASVLPLGYGSWPCFLRLQTIGRVSQNLKIKQKGHRSKYFKNQLLILWLFYFYLIFAFRSVSKIYKNCNNIRKKVWCFFPHVRGPSEQTEGITVYTPMQESTDFNLPQISMKESVNIKLL